ncbi:putative mitochondrial-processing peptidase subunit beta, mitochondrial [Wolffia australiana]
MTSIYSRVSRKIKSLSSTKLIPRALSLATHPEPSPDPTFSSRFNLNSSYPFQQSDNSHLLLFPQLRISTLPNGIRVATQTSPSSATHTASVGVWIDSGSRYDAPHASGTAHFLEHMIFKGTRRRTASSLEEEIENMGARLNAYTSREQTTYYSDVLSGDVPVAIDILADILQNSRFPDHAIRRERGVILREMEEVQGQIEEVLFDHLHMAAFKNHPLGNTILGPEENIRTISKGDLLEYISTHYTGPRMVISAAGAVKHEDIVEQVSKLFTKLSLDSTTAHQLVKKDPAVFTGSEVRVQNADMPLVHFALAFEGTSWINPSSIPLMVIQSLLGSWSRGVVGNCSGCELARRVSEGDLAESVMSFNTNYSDTGLIGVCFTATPVKLPDLSLVLMEELRRLACSVSDDEVIRAQNKLKAALLLHIDGASSVAENNGRQLLSYGRVIPFPELFARIEAVDSQTIKQTARNFLINRDLAIAAIGPIDQLPDYSWFKSQICMKID